MEFTGERYVPSEEGQIKYEHLHRYALSLEFVKGKSVLDMASGEGYGAALLATVAESVTGVDVDAVSVQHARDIYNNPKIRFVVGSCDAVPLPDQSFDVVTSFETIEHHDKHEEMLAEIKRVLRPGGVLIISSPNRLTYSDEPGYANPFHVKELYYEEFHNLLCRHFKNIRIYGQRLATGSFVFPLTPSGEEELTPLTGDASHLQREVCSLPSPIYFIALCSDSADVEKHPVNSVYLDNSDDLLRIREAETTRRLAQLQKMLQQTEVAAARKIQELIRSSESELSNLKEDVLRQSKEVLRARDNWSRELSRQFELLAQARAGVKTVDDLLLQAEERIENREELIRSIYGSRAWRISARIQQLDQVRRRLLPAGKLFQVEMASPSPDTVVTDDLVIEGWATSTAGKVIRVDAFLNDFYIGDVHYGLKHGESDCGFSQRLSLEGLVRLAGPAELKIRVLDEKGNKEFFTRPLQMRVENSSVFQGSLEAPKDGTIYSGHIDVVGWLFSSAAPIVLVEAFLDDLHLGIVPHGIERQDVASAFPSVAPLNSGFQQTISIQHLNLEGEKLLTVRGYDARGHCQTYQARIRVEPARLKIFYGSLETPKEGFTCCDSIWVSGWVFSTAAPVKAIDAFIDEIHLGSVRHGFDRFDVVGAFPLEGQVDSGFEDQLSLVRFGFQGEKRFVVRVLDEAGNAHTFSRTIAVRPANLSPFEETAAERTEKSRIHEAFAEVRDRLGTEPSVLDWESGLDLRRVFPELAVCSPPPPVGVAANQLPYSPISIDVVVLSAQDPNLSERTVEARRVASVAVIRASDQLAEIEWKTRQTLSLPAASILVPPGSEVPQGVMKDRRVLVCAPLMPEFDREGGSRRIFHFLEFFQQAGSIVHFVAEHPVGGERYARMLQQKGIPAHVLRQTGSNEKDALHNFERLIEAGRFDVVVFVFWYMAETYTAAVRAASPKTLIVVDTVDIEFLRQSRRVFLNSEQNGHGLKLERAYANQIVRELNVYGVADAVLTVSQKEADLVADFLGRPAAFCIPLAEDSVASTLPFSDRNGMFFLGNFRHPPNVQAVEYLCDYILPELPAAIRSAHPVYVVGNEFNQTVLDACRRSEHVRLVGWVPSVLPYLQQARISLVPLLYGAGTKTKLIHSLMVGTPTVSTSIGVEGLNLQHGVHVLVANDAVAFASSIERLINDEALWHRLSEQGRNFISAFHGRQAVFSRFIAVFDQILREHIRT